MTTVILAEKPSQALAYATAFQSSEKNEGFFNIKDPMFYDETLRLIKWLKKKKKRRKPLVLARAVKKVF